MGKFGEIQADGPAIQNTYPDRYLKNVYAYVTPKYINPMLNHWSPPLQCLFANSAHWVSLTREGPYVFPAVDERSLFKARVNI